MSNILIIILIPYNILKPHGKHGKWRPRSLKDLTKQHLNLEIQSGEHNPVIIITILITVINFIIIIAIVIYLLIIYFNTVHYSRCYIYNEHDSIYYI